jgi:hypothetical protein
MNIRAWACLKQMVSVLAGLPLTIYYIASTIVFPVFDRIMAML